MKMSCLKALNGALIGQPEGAMTDDPNRPFDTRSLALAAFLVGLAALILAATALLWH